MSLYKKLQECKSEEDVKQAYIHALNLKKDGYNLGLVDIKTDHIWFEAKEKPTSTYKMFTQLLHYVFDAHKKGEHIPPFLGVFDNSKAALMETNNALPLIKDKTLKWGTKASQLDPILVEKVSQHIGTYIINYNMQFYEKEFITAVKTAIAEKRIIRTQITPYNLKEVFDTWVEKVGKEIAEVGEEYYTLLFYADIMSDGSNPVEEGDNLPAYIIHAKGKPAFNLHGHIKELKNIEGYRDFWNIYEKPPMPEYRKEMMERQDSLIPLDHRKFTGAYYTPLETVKRAYELLNNTLGPNWQKEYIVWDMCCGVGNLEAYHNYPRNLFMSTLEKEHIDIINATKSVIGASVFQYDYLNDDINPQGDIDYTLSQKMPLELQKLIKEGKKKFLVLINPPYGEAGAGIGKGKDNKAEVSNTKLSGKSMEGFGKAKNELFTQFVARILQEVPNCTLAMFSTLKYVNAPNFVDFRAQFKAQYQGGFITHSQAFDGLKGHFPIGFLVWNINHTTPLGTINTLMIDKNHKQIGEKTFTPYTTKEFLNSWVERPKANSNIKIIPLKNSITPATANFKHLDNWSNNAIAYFYCDTNDLQNATQSTALFSSSYWKGHGMYITAQNLQQAAIMFTVRRIVKHIWYKDRDQFLIPHTPPSQDFANDCLIWMLFNGSNLTAGADGLEYNNSFWSLTNHFVPFTEPEVGAKGRYESYFLLDFLEQCQSICTLSEQSSQVLETAKSVYKTYWKTEFNYKIREEYKLGRPDVGWYQIRKSLEQIDNPYDFTEFKKAYQSLTDKLLPQVYDYGFLID